MSQNAQNLNGLQIAFNSGALAVGSTASGFAIGTLVNYTLFGRFLQRNTIATQALVIEPGTGIVPTAPQAFRTLLAGEGCAFAVLVDASGSLTVMQGDAVAASATAPVPAPPTNKVLFGVIKCVNNTASPFIPGTTLFTAITTTYLNYACHPGASV